MATQRPSSIKLFYFNIAGKAEALRLALNHVGIEFEDVRMTGDKFQEMKASGELAFGQIPALAVEVGGKTTTLVQTAAIARYIGRMSASSLYPEDLIKAVEVDAAMDQVTDMMTSVLCVKYQGRFGFEEALGGQDGAATKQVESAIQSSVMPRHFDFFEKLVSASSTGWIADTVDPTIADFVVGTQFRQLASNEMIKGPELMAKHPGLAAYVEKLHSLPSVVAWYKARESS